MNSELSSSLGLGENKSENESKNESTNDIILTNPDQGYQMWVRGKSNYNNMNEFTPAQKLQPIDRKKRKFESGYSDSSNNSSSDSDKTANPRDGKNKKSRIQLMNDDNNDDDNNSNSEFHFDPSSKKSVLSNSAKMTAADILSAEISRNLKLIRESFQLPLARPIYDQIINRITTYPFQVQLPGQVQVQAQNQNKNSNSVSHNTFNLDKHQISAIKSVLNGKSTFVVGGSKSGKTTVMHQLVKIAEKHKIKYVYLSGSLSNTIENAHHNCQYIKKWMCDIDPLLPDESHFKRKLVGQKQFFARFTNVELILIDDFPCVNYSYFTALNSLLQLLRQDSRLMGGATIVIGACLAQLSPISSSGSYSDRLRQPLFFQEPLWLKMGFKNHYLPNDYIHDDQLKQLLRKMRFGETTDDDIRSMQIRVISPSSILRSSIPSFAQMKHFAEKIDFSPKFTPVRLFNNLEMAREDQKNVNRFMHKEAKELNKFVDLNCNFDLEIKLTNYGFNVIHQNYNTLYKQQVQESHIPKSLTLYTGLQIYTTADIILKVTNSLFLSSSSSSSFSSPSIDISSISTQLPSRSASESASNSKLVTTNSTTISTLTTDEKRADEKNKNDAKTQNDKILQLFQETTKKMLNSNSQMQTQSGENKRTNQNTNQDQSQSQSQNDQSLSQSELQTQTILIPRGSIGVIVGWSEPEIIDYYRQIQISLPIVKFKNFPNELVKVLPHKWMNNLNCNTNEIIDFTPNHNASLNNNNSNSNSNSKSNSNNTDIINNNNNNQKNKNVKNNGTDEIIPGVVNVQLPFEVGWSSYLDESQPQLIYDEIFLRCDDHRNFIDSKFFYNALCRVRSLDGLKLEQFNKSFLKLDQRITSFYFQLEKHMKEKESEAISKRAAQISISASISNDDHEEKNDEEKQNENETEIIE